MQSVRVNHAHYAVEKSQARYNVQLCTYMYIPLPTPGIPHGGPLGRRTRPEAAHAPPRSPGSATWLPGFV